MVSKRQKLARKRFKEANPELFPKPELSNHGDSTAKKKKRKPNIKGKVLKTKNNSGKHPLRVPGMRPGENCFICKSSDHIAKLCPEKACWDKNKICLFCRQRGHSLKQCPEKKDTNDNKICYNCGEVGHSLHKCPLPRQDGETKYADCFICKERGHLSRNCPKNTHGIYPKGGSCKVCGGIDHLAKNCPNKGNKTYLSSTGLKISIGDRDGGRGTQHTIFQSGDDLEDDFMVEDTKHGKKIIQQSQSELPSSEHVLEEKIHVKQKKNQAPRVVNFFG
ncbi:Zinc finger CCHC-type protein [Dioscorea alata]|uniref:Zinc finger CCHC-type protein n=1 Tax=Dioscorea alata TaxID=55571 RepID=A0ACB7UQM4_DIOAL|nr:Zinc finger CCHC-type protein [Dioscorea alata]